MSKYIETRAPSEATDALKESVVSNLSNSVLINSLWSLRYRALRPLLLLLASRQVPGWQERVAF